MPLVIGRIHELIPHSAASQRAAWAQATTTFALFQAAGAYGLSYLFAHSGGDYALLFVIVQPLRWSRRWRSNWSASSCRGASVNAASAHPSTTATRPVDIRFVVEDMR